jgi:hypothetical protein
MKCSYDDFSVLFIENKDALVQNRSGEESFEKKKKKNDMEQSILDK